MTAAPAGGGLAEVLAVPKMPGPAFRLLWNGISYTVSKPGIGATDVYTAAQVRAFGRECLRSHGEAIAELIEADKEYDAALGLVRQTEATYGKRSAAAGRARAALDLANERRAAALSNIEGGQQS